MTLKDLNYSFSGSLTITEFVLLSLVILEDSSNLDTYVGEILIQILQKYFLYRYCYAKFSWTNSSRFFHGLLDSFKCHGKIGPTGKSQMFYLVRNYMDEYIHL